jgi:hypothetical protein
MRALATSLTLLAALGSYGCYAARRSGTDFVLTAQPRVQADGNIDVRFTLTNKSEHPRSVLASELPWRVSRNLQLRLLSKNMTEIPVWTYATCDSSLDDDVVIQPGHSITGNVALRPRAADYYLLTGTLELSVKSDAQSQITIAFDPVEITKETHVGTETP